MKKYIAALMLAFTLFGVIGYEAVHPETAYAHSRRRRSYDSRRRAERHSRRSYSRERYSRERRHSRRTVYYRCSKCELVAKVYSGQRPPRHRCNRGGYCNWYRR